MFKKRLITISALPFISVLLLGSSLTISKKPEKVSAISENHEHDGWTGVADLPTEAGDYYLTDNITLTATWEVPEGTTKLCLNGHVIDANGGNFNAITIPTGATLDLYDCGTTVHNGYVDNAGLWHLGTGGETVKAITGGIITGVNNSSTSNSGGVNVVGTFNFYGGNIVGNTTTKLGAGIYSQGDINMYGGNIAYNTTSANGGGVSFNNKDKTFNLTGGTIDNNTAKLCGGIQVTRGNFVMTGGSINNNTATNYGGIMVNNDSTFGGTAQIVGNTAKGDPSNFYQPSTPYKRLISFDTDKTPSEDMKIGLTLQDGKAKFTSDGVEDYSSNFFSDKLEYGVKYNSKTLGSEYLELVDAYAITNNTKEADKETNNGYIEVKESAIEGEEVSINVVPNAGYKLKSLFYNDGTKHDITTALSFEMQTTPVSVTAEFEGKAEQVIEIGDISKIYDGLPINFDQYSSALSYLGDGEVTIEFKVAGASDETYTTDRPVNAGEYTVRVSVAESSTHSAGVKTKDFTIGYAKINKVGFGDISQPVAGETAPTTVQGIAIGSRYAGSISWSPALVDGKFDCKTTYTATITLDIVPSSIENYVFAENVVLVKPNSEGWTKSTDSTQSKLVYTKTFANTGIHSLTEVPRKNPTCIEDGYKEAYYCSVCKKYFTDSLGEHEIGNLEAYNAWKLNEGKLSARHIVNMVPGVDPTKERSGYKEAWKCSECGQYFEDEACTVLIGDETAYNAWKLAGGYLPQLPSEGLSAGAIVGICVGSIFLLLLVIYLIGYFFLYRKGKLDEKKIKVIYKILPRGKKNLKEDEK